MPSEQKNGSPSVNADVPDVLIDKGIELFQKAYNDISVLTGGIAVTVTNISGMALELRVAPIFFEGWGSFGSFTPEAKIPHRDVAAFDMNFGKSAKPFIPYVGPLFINTALYSMLVYQSDEFDLGLGVYYWVRLKRNGPYARCALLPKNDLVSKDKNWLWDDLKTNSQSDAQLSRYGNISVYAALKQPGMNSFGLDVTVYK